MKMSCHVCVCARNIDFASFYDFYIEFWNCSNSVVFTLEKIEGVIIKGQSRDTSNIRHTRHRTKTNKAKNTAQKATKMSNSKMLDIIIRTHTQKHNTT